MVPNYSVFSSIHPGSLFLLLFIVMVVVVGEDDYSILPLEWALRDVPIHPLPTHRFDLFPNFLMHHVPHHPNYTNDKEAVLTGLKLFVTFPVNGSTLPQSEESHRMM